MILHSVVPQAMIFPEKESPYKYYRLKHGFAEYEMREGKMLIQRINSTNPADYLNEAFPNIQ